MGIIAAIVGPATGLLDRVVPRQRPGAKPAPRKLEGEQDRGQAKGQLALLVAEAQSPDRWTSRARPTFLYVMYALLLWAIPMGLIAAVSPALADTIAHAMSVYLGGLPEPLYALFGTGYLGYTVARQWGKVKGVDR